MEKGRKEGRNEDYWEGISQSESEDAPRPDGSEQRFNHLSQSQAERERI